MSKRFTETEKWRDPWFRKLAPEHKLLWLYVLDNCDNAGVWDPDLELVAILAGCDSQRVSEGLAYLSGRVSLLPCGKWHVNKFVEFQYGKLSEDCKPHIAVMKTLQKHGLPIDAKDSAENSNIPYAKGKPTLEDKEKEKDQEKDKERSERPPKLTDELWLLSLTADPAYAGIDVATEHRKMLRWCETNNRQPTRRRFVNWLNRCERPMTAKAGTAAPQAARLSTDIPDDEFFQDRPF
jgi:hypothetical protein